MVSVTKSGNRTESPGRMLWRSTPSFRRETPRSTTTAIGADLPGSPRASTRWCGRAPAGDRSRFFGDIQRALCQRDHRPPAGSEVALCPDRSRNLADVRGFRQRFGPIIARY
ncbi:hypothetical protein C4D60_Mb05t19970 [Musa balbisiana]|uniref:Uncharacterized protein n=1 Tax=Musa balbisiana TaxID=52838 RepID=A0A4S8JXG5_MUSBA|nr:hypothetical protein C4D60_Mb05t19950 [Musa balbisiana]THU66990.1 hypothetical protein C4D60_Mb05t19970 [Musa balbisiana]